MPTTGADYDADSAGGAIRITLRKRRENGIDGSVSFNTSQAEIVNKYNPSANINIHSGRTDFYASAWGSFGGDKTTHRRADPLRCRRQGAERPFGDEGPQPQFRGQRGTVFEINPRHSVGAEFEYWRNRDGEPTTPTPISATAAR